MIVFSSEVKTKTTHVFSATGVPALKCSNMEYIHLSFSVLSGAEFQAKDLGRLIEQTTVEQLIIARKVTISGSSTTIIAYVATKDEI